MRLLLGILFLVTLGIDASSQGIVHITGVGNTHKFDLSGKIFYLPDTADVYTFEQVLSPDFDNKFILSEKDVFSYKGGIHSVWYKIIIKNNTHSIQHLILSIDNPLINDISFYDGFDSVYYHTGLLYPFYQRQIPYKNYLFKLKIDDQNKGVVCFKITSQSRSEFIPVSLRMESETLDKVRVNSFISGVYYSILFIFLLITYIIYLSDRSKKYLSLFLVLLTMGAVNLWRDGYLFQYIFPNYPDINLIVGKILHPLSILFFIIFIYHFLHIDRSSKYLSALAKTTLAYSIIVIVTPFFTDNYNVYFEELRVLFVLFAIISVWGSVVSRNFGIRNYYQFVPLILLFAADRILVSFFMSETVGLGFYDFRFSTIISILFFVVIFYLFASKFQRSRLEVIELNRNLESLVEKRTEQLSIQKEELKSQQEELIQQKEILQTQREELRAKKELLEMQNAELTKLSLVASKTDNLIYIFLPNGELDWFNTSFSAFIGMTLEEYKKSNHPLSILDISTNKNIRHVLNTCLREKTVISYESKKEDDETHAKWFHTTLTPILDDKENIEYLIAIDTDITRLKQYEEELNKQRQDAEMQKNLAVVRKEELEARQMEIMDSIRYAKRIQTGIMPKVKQIQRDFHDSFILFLPKDIVSGDFYWYHRIQDKYFIAAVDCTGHGVPGAFMSIIGTYLLNSIIIYNEVYNPADILKQLNRKIKIALKADANSQTNDGMDISIAVVDKKENTISIASALRPVYLFNKGDFIEIKGDKIPISSNISGTTISSFTEHNYPFYPDDMFYLFSDGIIDQFGGKHGKKFLTKRFKQLLFEINPLSMKEQKGIIKKAFDEWKGENEQVDDVLVMGVRYKDLDH